MTDKPLAAAPYKSYRYSGRYGSISIGAYDDKDAIKQVARSVDKSTIIDIALLERWDGEKWVSCKT